MVLIDARQFHDISPNFIPTFQGHPVGVPGFLHCSTQDCATTVRACFDSAVMMVTRRVSEGFPRDDRGPRSRVGLLLSRNTTIALAAAVSFKTRSSCHGTIARRGTTRCGKEHGRDNGGGSRGTEFSRQSAWAVSRDNFKNSFRLRRAKYYDGLAHPEPALP